jgi:glutathione-specific gamma-glutamylcyclotransferase
MSLCASGSAPGVVLRMAGEDLAAALVALMMTEQLAPPQWLTADNEQGPLRAIAFTVHQTDPQYCPEPPEDAVADMLASAVDQAGTMAEYLLNTVTELERAGVHDPYLWRMQEMVADRLAPLQERAS